MWILVPKKVPGMRLQKHRQCHRQSQHRPGELGAIQTRFEKTVENIDIQNENLTAARGRVVMPTLRKKPPT